MADKLGIDLVWFGILLAVNMQTSFMHPPFGFALFYLRSVAPARAYMDKLTGRRMAPITTGQIYWGAIPFVVIQIIMVSLVIAFPQMVMVYKSQREAVDPNQVEIVLPPMQAPTLAPLDDLGSAFGAGPAPEHAEGSSDRPTDAPSSEPTGTPPDDLTDLFR